jgi:hypothetical protein
MSRAPDPASAGDDAGHGASRDQSRGHGERFAAGMPLDAAAAGPVLAAALAGTRPGMDGLSDDALAGFLRGCQKIAAWAAGMLPEGIAEYAHLAWARLPSPYETAGAQALSRCSPAGRADRLALRTTSCFGTKPALAEQATFYEPLSRWRPSRTVFT